MKKNKDKKLIQGEQNIAIALNYDKKNAPRITAKGENLIAQQIIDMADKHDVPLYPDPDLASTLVQIPLGDEVPEELYRAVAEVISFAYLLAGKMPEGFTPKQDNDIA